MELNNVASLAYFAPELLLSGTVAVVLLLDLVSDSPTAAGIVAMAASLVTFVLVAAGGVANAWLFNGMIVFDSFAFFFRLLITLATIVAIWMSIGSEEVKLCEQGEYYAVLLAAALGMFLMAEANNLLMAYLSLELVSLTSYILTGFLKHNRRSQEAALKYLIYGGVASGTMIYGMSWIFGIAGSLDFMAINRALFATSHIPVLAVFIALVLILSGLGYKVASVHFH